MKPGVKTDVVLLDRNLMDALLDPRLGPRLRAGVHYENTVALQNAAAVITRRNARDIQFQLRFLRDESDNFARGEEMWPHLEFKKGEWYPLTLRVSDAEYRRNASLTQEYKCGNVGGLMPPSGCAPWTAFDRSTHVGWRGPMIPWARLADLPPIVFASSDLGR